MRVCPNNKPLLERVRELGWTFDRARGSHYVFVHPVHKFPLVIAHPWKKLGRRQTHRIEKLAEGTASDLTRTDPSRQRSWNFGTEKC